MTVASGTSTPTSITVVATRSRVSPAAKRAIAASFSAPFMLAVHEADRVAETLLAASAKRSSAAARSIVFGFLDQRADPVDPLAVVERAADRVDHFVEPLERHGAGVDRLAAGRLLAQLARRPCRRNRSAPACAGSASRSCTSMSTASPLRGERQALVHAEAVLLVDDGEREIAERDVLLEQRVGADERCRSRRAARRVEHLGALACRARGRSGSRRAGRPPRRAARCVARCWRARISVGAISAAWPPGLDHGRGGEQRHHGLAGADVALQQPQHALAAARDRRRSRRRARACDGVSE